MPGYSNGSLNRERLKRLAFFAGVVTLSILTSLTLPLWFEALTPHWLERSVKIGFLWGFSAAYLIALAAAPVALLMSVWWMRQCRRRQISWQGAGRLLLLCLSTILGIAFLEAGAKAWQVWNRELPRLPKSFGEVKPVHHTDVLPDPAQFETQSGGSDTIRIVVIGESSARGEPYSPWLSVGQIVGWQLERIFPGRTVEVDVRAKPGISLELAIQTLQDLKTRPDAILIYSGHNEFQARFSWFRYVSHYKEEAPNPPRQEIFLAETSRYSNLLALIRETLEKQRLDITPAPIVTRELVDHPAYTPEEYAFTRSEFRRRLDAVVAYCETIGALPILVIPASNDGDFAPIRSVLSATAGAAERATFGAEFRAARALETTDPASSQRAYRTLLNRHPEFAETHYRLARLLDVEGRWGEANEHYTKARDLDGLSLRCPSDFQEAYRDVARNHDVVLADGPEVLRSMSSRGVLDAHLFHDAHHPSLRSYVALSQRVVDGLQSRRAFGWPQAREAPLIDEADCAGHFGIDQEKWAVVCDRAAKFYNGTAHIRYDPSESLQKGKRYDEAARLIRQGVKPEDVGVPGVGVAIRAAL